MRNSTVIYAPSSGFFTRVWTQKHRKLFRLQLQMLNRRKRRRDPRLPWDYHKLRNILHIMGTRKWFRLQNGTKKENANWRVFGEESNMWRHYQRGYECTVWWKTLPRKNWPKVNPRRIILQTEEGWSVRLYIFKHTVLLCPFGWTRTAKCPLWPMVLGCVRLDGKHFMA